MLKSMAVTVSTVMDQKALTLSPMIRIFDREALPFFDSYWPE